MNTYNKLSEALKQLEDCKFVDAIGHPLELNIAFIALKDVAKGHDVVIAHPKIPSEALTLSEVVSQKNVYENLLKEMRHVHSKRTLLFEEHISRLDRLEKIATSADLDLNKVQLAEKTIQCGGDILARVDGRVLADAACVDIANGGKFLSNQFFGNKSYEAFYQSCDCQYGYGPKHGGIVDSIELRKPSEPLTPEQQEACIYYLKNYAKIKALNTVK